MIEKDSLYKYCTEFVQQRIDRIKQEINRAQSDANEETKSSMGDKYETSRAMTQLDIERNRILLSEAEKIKSTLHSISVTKSTDTVMPGSLVTTSTGVFYIAISIGIVNVQGKDYFIVSSDSPIGKLLLGKKTGDVNLWQGKEIKIQNIE